MNYTIDLLITMVTDDCRRNRKGQKEILTDFLCSKTGKALYDEKNKSCGAMVRHI